MNLLEQCNLWNEEEKYEEIIKALEAVKVEDRTPEFIYELARGYNNYATVDDLESFQKAITLLESVEEHFKNEHNWNFRMGYAYYYLDEEHKALFYFNRALELAPGDEDTIYFIEGCKKALSLPRFKKPFAQRVEDFWTAFMNEKEQLQEFVENRNKASVANTLIEQCHQLLAIALKDISFELGYNGEKYELILSPDGDSTQLLKLIYIKQQAPKAVFEKWNIIIGRVCSPQFALRAFDQEVSGEDVQVWIRNLDDFQHIGLELYCEKLLPLLSEDKSQVIWFMSILVDQMLGEIPAMNFIQQLDVVFNKKEEESIPLHQLRTVLETRGFPVLRSAEEFMEHYTAYEVNFDNEESQDLRFDVFAGSTRLPGIVHGYYGAEDTVINSLHQDGAVGGFLFYPLDCFENNEEVSKTILDFRDNLEFKISEALGAKAITFIGGASAPNYGYLDFIAWDLEVVLNEISEILTDTPLSWASFHTFRKGTQSYNVMDSSAEESDSTGKFVGFALMSKPHFDKEGFIQDMKEEWNIDVQAEGEDTKEDVLIFEEEQMTAILSLIPAPVPNQEAEINAENNYMWKNAVEVTKAHEAHFAVAVFGEEISLIDKGKLFAKIMACCCKQEFVTGVFTSGTVFQPEYYLAYSQMMKEDELPIYNWIWIGLYKNEEGASAYTYGMDVFGKDEMEVLNANADLSEVRDFLTNMVTYVLEDDVTLLDGETIGFSENDIHTIEVSDGVSLPTKTIKIGYESEHKLFS